MKPQYSFYTAGISYRGSIEATDMDVHVKVMVVNYFGQIALTKGMFGVNLTYIT